MNSPPANFNPHLSVDCVIFGFDGDNLRVLLIKRKGRNTGGTKAGKYKLPGDLIHLKEDLEGAAKRVLAELTGLENIFLRQFSVFGNPNRTTNEEDHAWLEESSGIPISRVVTTAYYSLIRIDKSKTENENNHHASWHKVDELPNLVFDHNQIVEKGLATLRNEIRFEPICFELLPGKFTIRQIQTLYEVIFGKELDNRNFRKKLLKAKYIVPLNEKQKGVAHKPALYYSYNRNKYVETREDVLYYNF